MWKLLHYTDSPTPVNVPLRNRSPYDLLGLVSTSTMQQWRLTMELKHKTRHWSINISHVKLYPSQINVVSIIIEQFLPEQHRKYLFLSFQMDPTYRAYTTHAPSYLQGRPRNAIIHCLEREERARKTLSPADITDVDSENGIFSIRGKSGYIHTVDFGSTTGKPSCTYQDWVRNNIPCKHLYLLTREGGGGVLSHRAIWMVLTFAVMVCL